MTLSLSTTARRRYAANLAAALIINHEFDETTAQALVLRYQRAVYVLCDVQARLGDAALLVAAADASEPHAAGSPPVSRVELFVDFLDRAPADHSYTTLAQAMRLFVSRKPDERLKPEGAQ